jgi:hypothetical protein
LPSPENAGASDAPLPARPFELLMRTSELPIMSRTKTSATPFVSVPTCRMPVLWNATYLPSADMEPFVATPSARNPPLMR